MLTFYTSFTLNKGEKKVTKQTIRLLMPQWQGGNNPNYSFGAELLAWLAPGNDQPLIHVPVQAFDGIPLENENGTYGRKQLLEQLEAAHHIIYAHKPDCIVMFGGDCLVEQARLYRGTRSSYRTRY
jgi:arginase